MLTSKHVEAVNGSKAHWLVECPDAKIIETNQLPNRSGAIITSKSIKPDGGWAIENKMFKQGEPVAIAMPTGKWQVETSGDGTKYYPVTVLASEATLLGQSQRVNLILDGAPFAQRFARYTKLA